MSPASTTSTERARTPGLFPVTLRLAGARCLVVGGGAVAARKAEALLRTGAEVTVVAPRISQELQCLVDAFPAARDGSGSLTWKARAFSKDDITDQRLVVAATDDREVNRSASAAARRSGALLNVVDDPEASDFIVPSVLERGSLQIAVSTSGRAPALAASLRRRLEELWPPEWAQVVELVAAARQAVLAAALAPSERQRLNSEMASLDFAGLLATDGLPGVSAALTRLLPAGLATSLPAGQDAVPGGRP